MEINELKIKLGYTITVDNSIALTHNINVDCPTFFCFANSEAEAIEKMAASDFQHKHRAILRIDAF